MVKKGRQNGHQKWYCKSCGHYFSGRKNDKQTTVINIVKTGRYTAKDIGEKLRLSSRQVYRYMVGWHWMSNAI